MYPLNNDGEYLKELIVFLRQVLLSILSIIKKISMPDRCNKNKKLMRFWYFVSPRAPVNNFAILFRVRIYLNDVLHIQF